MATYRDILSQTQAQLDQADLCFGHGYESAHDEAVALVLGAAGLPITTGQEILDQQVSQTTLDMLERFVQRRVEAREPVAYIIGHACLGPLSFIADTRALIPRSPLMSVIESGFGPWWQGDDPRVVVDVCCGGGSLGILAAWAFPETQVTLLDLDHDALSLAHENAALHGLSNVSIAQGDLLEPIKGKGCVDIILANPPYVDAMDMAQLPPEYLHEPQVALTAGIDGLDLVHRLFEQASTVLSPHGLLFLEVGNSWGALERAYPRSAFTWLMLASGGHGVCVMTLDEINSALLARQSTHEKV